MARKLYVYKVIRIKDSPQWPKGTIIWVDDPCPGWRVLVKRRVQ